MAGIVTVGRIRAEVARAKRGTVRHPIRIELSQRAWDSLRGTDPLFADLPAENPSLRLLGLPVRVWAGLEADCRIVTA